VKVAVAEADIARDRDRLLEVLARNFEQWGDRDKFEWLYSTNPFGRARVWVLEDEAGRLAGLSAAFPRRLRAQGRTLEAWVLGDFCVDKEQRALGPAIALQRAVCEAVTRGEADVWYDFPSRSMSAVYGRMGLRPAGEFVRMVRPLRVDRKVAEKLDDGLLAKSVAFVGTSLLSARDLLSTKDRSIEVEELGQDLEAFRDSRRDGVGVELDRTVDYLVWRYRAAPRESASILLARRDGKAVGGIVFRSREQDVAIVDLLGVADESVLRELVREVVDLARSRKAERVVVALSSAHRWIATFEKLGFSKRESSPYFIYPRAGALDAGSPWSLTSGDRDL
jgi:predicted N-acetyltransferase YhbS